MPADISAFGFGFRDGAKRSDRPTTSLATCTLARLDSAQKDAHNDSDRTTETLLQVTSLPDLIAQETYLSHQFPTWHR